MKKIILITIFLILITTTLLFTSPKITGKIIEKNKYSYTKAICDKKNYCKDYIIECENGILSKITPTGFAIQKSKNWKDKRNSTKNYCN